MTGDELDLRTGVGRSVAIAIAIAVAGAAWLLAARAPGSFVALPLTALALVPVFCTGSRAQLPAEPRELASGVLRPIRDRLARLVDLAHVEMRVAARFINGSNEAFDEVRLVCAPTDRTPGLRAIELALAMAAPGLSGAVPQVLVRFDDGSPVAARIEALCALLGARVMTGRAADERVARIVPREPTAAAASVVLATLLAELEGRRREDRTPASQPAPAYRGKERRGRLPARRPGRLAPLPATG